MPTPCKLWQGRRGAKAWYPRVWVNGKAVYVHRRACEEAHGPPPSPRHMALHACNQPLCYEGDHLYWGTKKENTEDTRRAGTMPLGEKHGCSKLTGEEVRQIRASSEPSRKIAPRYGIAASTVRSLRNGNGNWKWLK